MKNASEHGPKLNVANLEVENGVVFIFWLNYSGTEMTDRCFRSLPMLLSCFLNRFPRVKGTSFLTWRIVHSSNERHQDNNSWWGHYEVTQKNILGEVISRVFKSWRVLGEKLGGHVRPASQNPYPIYDQTLWFCDIHDLKDIPNARLSMTYLWPKQQYSPYKGVPRRV